MRNQSNARRPRLQLNGVRVDGNVVPLNSDIEYGADGNENQKQGASSLLLSDEEDIRHFRELALHLALEHNAKFTQHQATGCNVENPYDQSPAYTSNIVALQEKTEAKAIVADARAFFAFLQRG